MGSQVMNHAVDFASMSMNVFYSLLVVDLLVEQL